MRLVLLGPPGAGKGTQARMIAEQTGVAHVASGDLLRAAVRDRTSLGTEAKRYMDRGVLVPDELVLKLIEQRLKEGDARTGFILDGFPRSRAQAQTLDAMLAASSVALDKVIAINVTDEEIVKRISGRRTCGKCGAMYHVIFDPPRNLGVCNQCNSELYQREDDSEETVRMRLEVYARETKPLLDYYAQNGLLVEVEGLGRPEDVLGRILAALGKSGAKHAS